MKTLIVYYSFGGNTRKIARMLQDRIGGDLAEIETAVPYTGDYNAVVAQGEKEIQEGYMPELKPLDLDVSGYDRIILGTPVWWYTFAPAVKTFLHETSLAGKVVWPFATNGGWIGHTFRDVEPACPGAEVKPGLNLRFDGRTMTTPEREIDAWIKKIGK